MLEIIDGVAGTLNKRAAAFKIFTRVSSLCSRVYRIAPPN
jgi:hypothetical protein